MSNFGSTFEPNKKRLDEFKDLLAKEGVQVKKKGGMKKGKKQSMGGKRGSLKKGE